MIIGICGPSGSGKTYYSKTKEKLENSSIHKYSSIIIVHMDNFIKEYHNIMKNNWMI